MIQMPGTRRVAPPHLAAAFAALFALALADATLGGRIRRSMRHGSRLGADRQDRLLGELDRRGWACLLLLERTPRRKPSSRTRPATSRKRKSSSPPSKPRRRRVQQGVQRGRRQQARRGSHRRTVEGRRLRVPRRQARYRPQSRVRADQGRARHGRLWLVRQCHLPRQGRRRRSSTPSISGSSPTATSSR